MRTQPLDSSAEQRPVKRYPRVLLVVKTRINGFDGTGASLRNWLHDFPRENLAQVYSGGAEDEEPFCAHNYRLGPQDRRFGRLFVRLKRQALEAGSLGPRPPRDRGGAPRRGQLRRGVNQLAVESGLWELVFAPRLSDELLKWARSFRPDVIYAQGFDLTFVRLPIWLSRALGVPICTQISDDWPGYLYRRSPFAPIVRPVLTRATRTLMHRSAERLCTGERMAEAFADRYGVEFTPVMICDDPARFDRAKPASLAADGERVIVYSGSLYLKRWEALADLCQAVRLLRETGVRYRLLAFAGMAPDVDTGTLNEYPELDLLPPLDDKAVPGIFRGADILFLPESFTLRDNSAIRYSISTKSHLYMMSRRPILAYGPSDAGVIDYARRHGWASIVDSRSPERLAEAIRELTVNEACVARLVERGRQVAAERHEAAAVREQFRSALTRAADGGAR